MQKYINTYFLVIITILLTIIVSKSFLAPEKQVTDYDYSVIELYPTNVKGADIKRHAFYRNLNQGWEPVTTFYLSSNNTTWCILRRPKPTQ